MRRHEIADKIHRVLKRLEADWEQQWVYECWDKKGEEMKGRLDALKIVQHEIDNIMPRYKTKEN